MSYKRSCEPSDFNWRMFSRWNEHGGYVWCNNCPNLHWVKLSIEEGQKLNERPMTPEEFHRA